MLRKRKLRRIIGALFVAAGALAMWLAPESLSGALLLAAGIALEAVGLGLEHRAGREKEHPHALDR